MNDIVYQVGAIRGRLIDNGTSPSRLRPLCLNKHAKPTPRQEEIHGQHSIPASRNILPPPVARRRALQVHLGDGTRAVHCYERECSLQRQRQKVWEEAGAVCLDDETREALCVSAVARAEAVNYKGAGTLEFLYNEASNEFFFIEMNTRTQGEHPVAEMITGIDLVQEMIRIAGGEPPRLTQDQIPTTGLRINAENPHVQFMPCPGLVGALTLPEGDGIRVDHFLYEGYQIPPF